MMSCEWRMGDVERTIRHSPFAIRLSASGLPLSAKQVLENAQNGKGTLLAGVGMDLGSAPLQGASGE
jgi:hypothetical protein